MYFLNIVGLVRYELPGLFLDLPYPRVVNGSLWTVPYELECYIYLTIFMLAGVFRRRVFVLMAYAAVTLLVIQLGEAASKGIIVLLKEMLVSAPKVNANLQQADEGIKIVRILVLSFFAGAVIFTWRYSLPFTPWLAALAAALGFLMLRPGLYIFAPLPLAYLTVWLGLQTPAKLPMIFSGDYSYGIYLYAFPIQQAIIQVGLVQQSFWALFLLSLAATSCFAVFSWHFIEKPFLKLKPIFLAKSPQGRKTA